MSYNNAMRGEYGGGNGGRSSYQPRENRQNASLALGRYSGNSSNYGRGPQGPQHRRPFNKDRAPQQSRNFLNVYNQGNAYSQQNGDTNQLWMGDLDPSWDESSIRQIWATFGDTPVSVKLIKDRNSDPSRGVKPSFCFVTFANERAASAAVAKNGLQVPGFSRTFKLNWASGGNSREDGQFGGRNQGRQQSDPSVFVGDLGAEVTEAMLYAKFNERYPNQIKQVKVMTDAVKKVSKGFGFVRFYTASVQQAAIDEMSGTIVGSRPIRVGHAGGSNTQSTHAVSHADAKSESPAFTKIPIAQHQPPLSEHTDPHNTTVLVKGLSAKFSESQLANYFISFGDIVSCKITSNLNEGYVKFYTREAAEKAILLMYGFSAHGCRLAIGWGNPKKETDATAKYTKQPVPPASYGKFAINHIRLDKLSNEQVDRLLEDLFEESEPSGVDSINFRFLAAKKSRDELLRNSF